MASSHGNAHSDAARTEQIITEFFAKSLHIILESRSPFASSRHYSGDQALSSPSSSTSSTSSMRPRDKWFNLALRDCPEALENIDFWRQSNLEPMIVDVILVKRLPDTSARNIRNLEGKSEKIIERWVVKYENKKSKDASLSNRRCSVLQTIYKKSILLLRSLYLTVRLLPAYKYFGAINSSGKIHTFTIVLRVLSFVEPFTRKEESEMQHFGFTPIDTSSGRLCVSVMYRSLLSDLSSEPSTPMTPRFISDYVGSPIADPIKRLPSLPMTGYRSSNNPFERPHSWSHGLYKAAPLPKKNIGFDAYFPTPQKKLNSPYSSSPIFIPGSQVSNAILRAESAPVKMAISKAFNSPPLTNKQTLAPSSPLKGSKLSGFKDRKSAGSILTGTTVEKMLYFSKDESGRFSGLRTSCNSSPRISLSRSSSRLSFQEDLEESEFACPFIVDDDDMADPSSRSESVDKKSHLLDQIEGVGSFPVKMSQHAAVGALVQMLKKAPPLCQDISNSTNASRMCGDHISQHSPLQSSVMSKTTSDALEELRGYREIKHILLSKSNISHLQESPNSEV